MKPTLRSVPTSSDPSSEELARAAQQGDQQALNRLLNRHKHEVFRIALRMLGNPADAEEILQDTLERAFRHLGRYDSRRKFRPWLLRIASNRAKSMIVRQKARRFLSLDQFRGSPRQPQAREGRDKAELREAMQEALMSLPTSHRAVFILKHIEGLSYDEISEVTGVKVGALKVRNHRTRRHLLEWMSASRVTRAPLSG